MPCSPKGIIMVLRLHHDLHKERQFYEATPEESSYLKIPFNYNKL